MKKFKIYLTSIALSLLLVTNIEAQLKTPRLVKQRETVAALKFSSAQDLKNLGFKNNGKEYVLLIKSGDDYSLQLVYNGEKHSCVLVERVDFNVSSIRLAGVFNKLKLELLVRGIVDCSND